jgi:hypothetical protein
MAIDTAEKRRSMMAFRTGRRTLPIPDGQIDAGDRLTLMGKYSGIAVVAPPPRTMPRGRSGLLGMAGGGTRRVSQGTNYPFDDE